MDRTLPLLLICAIGLVAAAAVGSALELGTLAWIAEDTVRTIRMDSGASPSVVGTHLSPVQAVGSGLFGSLVLAGLSDGESFIALQSVQPFSGAIDAASVAVAVPGNRTVVCASAFSASEGVFVTDDLAVFVWNVTSDLNGQVAQVGALESDAQFVATGAPLLRATCAVAYSFDSEDSGHKGLAYLSRSEAAETAAVRFFNLTANASTPALPLEHPTNCSDFAFTAEILNPTFMTYLTCRQQDAVAVYVAAVDLRNAVLLGSIPASHAFPDVYGLEGTGVTAFLGVSDTNSSYYKQTATGFDRLGDAAPVSFAGSVGVAYIPDYGRAPLITSTTSWATVTGGGGDGGDDGDDSLPTGEIVVIVVGCSVLGLILLLLFAVIVVIAVILIRSKKMPAAYMPIA